MAHNISRSLAARKGGVLLPFVEFSEKVFFTKYFHDLCLKTVLERIKLCVFYSLFSIKLVFLQTRYVPVWSFS